MIQGTEVLAEGFLIDGKCKGCGSSALRVPDAPTENTWINCAECKLPVTTWGKFKADALDTAAATIRKMVSAKRR
jgi:hypothetical protein